jgi:hypothetical protein
MKEKLFLLGILLILIGTLWFLKPSLEGFTETIQNNLQDRANPLAATTNPLQNPAIPIGVSVQEAEQRRNIAISALNVPTAIPTGNGSFTQVANNNPLSPRIDNEESYLGLIKFCKDESKKPGNPFDNSKFAETCGVCFTSGSLATGESFSTPTGVLVYGKDKEKAIRKQKEAGHLFPRAIPSLQAGVCKNASTSDDSMPVLAITKEDYNAFKRRLECRHSKEFGNGCAICQVNKEWSWVNPNGGMSGSTLLFWGEGELVVKLNGVPKQEKPFTLNETNPTQVDLGRIPEGTSFSFEVKKGESSNGPYIFGALVSSNANDKPYRISIDKIIQKDRISGSTPRKSTPRFFMAVRMSLPKLMAGGTSDLMVLEGIFPFTFIQKDQLAGYDCATSPMFQKLESADLLIQDPCIRPGPTSVECIRSKILEAGCSTEGEFYTNEQQLKGVSEDLEIKRLSMNILVDILKYVRKEASKKDIMAGKFCLGKDFTTPCDFQWPPSKECLTFLYENKGREYPRIGPSYSGSGRFTSLKDKTIQFCQKSGTLHPSNPQGYAELLGIANSGYRGRGGLDAVKLYLSDVYSKATGNLDANVKDSDGGKKDSYMKCFGHSIADAPLPTVKLNSLGTVTSERPESCILSLQSYTPRINWLYNSRFFFHENYSLSFTIKPRGIVGTWANIVHFTIDGNMGKFGERSPAIWFFPGNTRLHIRIGDARDTNWGIDTNNLPMNQESRFRLVCFGNTVTCTINDTVINATQPSRRFSGQGKVYLGDPWHPAANCEIKNFCYSQM